MNPATRVRMMALLFMALAASTGPYIAREGYELVAYPDPVHGAKVPTYCAGLTGGGVKVGDRFTEEECFRRVMLSRVEHIVPILPCIREDIPVTPTTGDYLGVMASMSDNIGTGKGAPRGGFLNSAMCRHMKAGEYRKACDAIKLYKYAGGVDCSNPNQRVCRGLWADRLKSHETCIKAIPR